MSTRTIKNPNELLSFLFSDPASRAEQRGTPRASSPRSDADFAAELEARFSRLRKIARKTIRDAGLDPAQSQRIASERDAADAVFWAAQMLTELDRVQQYLARVRQSDLQYALGEVLSSLVFAGLYHSFTLIGEEPDIIVEFAARTSASKTGQGRSDKYAHLARQMAVEFQKRQHARDLAAGAIMGTPRPSDAELKRQIGTEHGLGKSAAADAIDHGLALLHRGAASG